jgi:hypothetical protein
VSPPLRNSEFNKSLHKRGTQMVEGTVMIIGLGQVGGKTLELLARKPGITRIVGADVNEAYGFQKVNNAAFGAQLEGYYPNIDFVKVDLMDVDMTSETLAEIKPSIIFNSTSLQSYWVVESLPKEIHKKFQEAGYGPWLPMHLVLCHKLMQAVGQSGIKAWVVNGAYPDAVNPTLAEVGQAPVAGIGNLDLVIPQLRKVISMKMKVPTRSVSPMLVMHHYAEYWVVREGHSGGAPYYLKVLVDGNDVTGDLNPEELFKDIIKHAKRLGHPEGHYLVASSAIQKILSLYHDTGEISHVAGPGGLVGGYPVRLSQEGAELALPREISREEAIRINLESQRLEGIEKIKNDGTVVFTDKSCEIMKELLGYECKTMKREEYEERAAELGRRYEEFSKRHLS